ncbi:MAG: hypothetical protein Q9M40_01995 [Sulfurimonas sp.]|nr:hypothetical protein [Sulfurimonas sp.]
MILKTKGYSIDTINQWIKNCFNDTLDFKKLILAKPDELEKLSKIYKFKCCNNFSFFNTLYDYLNKNDKFYMKGSDGKEVYNAYKLVKSLNLSVCPYCNRNTIYNITNKNRRTSDLDHFYPKSKYPFLAVSFYNLIPSCKNM